jgi:hypothetical protein
MGRRAAVSMPGAQTEVGSRCNIKDAGLGQDCRGEFLTETGRSISRRKLRQLVLATRTANRVEDDRRGRPIQVNSPAA